MIEWLPLVAMGLWVLWITFAIGCDVGERRANRAWYRHGFVHPDKGGWIEPDEGEACPPSSVEIVLDDDDIDTVPETLRSQR